MNQLAVEFWVFNNVYGNRSNSADLDQRAPAGALLSASTLFEKIISVLKQSVDCWMS